MFRSPFIRCEEADPLHFQPATVLFVGNGAVKNGWIPFLEAAKQSRFIDSVSPPSRAQGTSYASLASIFYRHGRSGLDRKDEGGKAQAQTALDAVRELKIAIAKKYIEHAESEKIQLREPPPEIAPILAKSVGVLTSNWDQLLEAHPIYGSNLVKLHGSSEHPESLVFPGECIADELTLEKEKVFETEHLIGGENLSELAQTHHVAVTWIQAADNLVIWGYSGNAYDMELLALLLLHRPSTTDPIAKTFIVNSRITHARHLAWVMGLKKHQWTFVKA
jgi:hypothetical protein